MTWFNANTVNGNVKRSRNPTPCSHQHYANPWVGPGKGMTQASSDNTEVPHCVLKFIAAQDKTAGWEYGNMSKA